MYQGTRKVNFKRHIRSFNFSAYWPPTLPATKVSADVKRSEKRVLVLARPKAKKTTPGSRRSCEKRKACLEKFWVKMVKWWKETVSIRQLVFQNEKKVKRKKSIGLSKEAEGRVRVRARARKIMGRTLRLVHVGFFFFIPLPPIHVNLSYVVLFAENGTRFISIRTGSEWNILASNAHPLSCVKAENVLKCKKRRKIPLAQFCNIPFSFVLAILIWGDISVSFCFKGASN